MVVVNRSGPGFKRNPRLGGSPATLTTITTAPPSARHRVTARSRGRRSDDDISGAHVGDIGQIPDTLFAGFTAKVHGAVRQFGRGLTKQRIGPAASTTPSAATAAGGGITACSRRGRLLAQ